MAQNGPINPQTGAVVGTAVGGPGVGTAVGSFIGWLGQNLFGGSPDPVVNAGSSIAGFAMPPHLGTRLIAVLVALIALTVVFIRLTVTE